MTGAMYDCYWCSLSVEPCRHVRQGTEPIANARAMRQMIAHAPGIDSVGNPILGVTSDTIYSGDLVAYDTKSRRFKRASV